MNMQLQVWIPEVLLGFGLVQFILGILMLITQRNYLKQVLGMKVMLQGIILILVSEGWRRQDIFIGEAIIISALIVEAVVLAIAISLLIQIAKKARYTDLLEIRKERNWVNPADENG